MNKKYKVVIILMIAVVGIILILNKNNIFKSKQSTIILNEDVIEKTGNNFKLSRKGARIYNWQPFYIYVDDKNIGKFNIYYDNGLYLFDENRKAIKYQGNIIATNDKKLNLIGINQEKIGKDEYIENIVKTLGFENYYDSFNDIRKVDVDIDDDGIKDEVYTISNAFNTENETGNNISIIFTVIKENIIIIDKKEQDDGPNYMARCSFDIKGLIKDNKNTYLLSRCSKFSNQSPDIFIYEYKKNKFENILK